MTEPNQPIASIARQLAAELIRAAAGCNAPDAPQQKISELQSELIEAFRNELREAVTVRV